MVRLIFALSACSLVACGCSNGAIAFEDLCQVQNSDRLIVAEGYLNTSDRDIPCRESAGMLKCMLEFAASPEDTSFVSAYVLTGNGPNQLDPRATPGSSYLLRAHDGEPLNADDLIRLEGLVYVQDATDSLEAVCAFREVKSIERVDA